MRLIMVRDWPRRVGFALVFALGGCAVFQKPDHAAAPAAAPVATAQPVPVAPPPPPPPKPHRQVREVRETKEPEKVVSVDPTSLIGLAPEAVEKLLGAPSSISKGDPLLVWTYNGQGCSFQIFFYPDIKTAAFHALKYGSLGGNNEQTDESQACVRGILTVKDNGPG